MMAEKRNKGLRVTFIIIMLMACFSCGGTEHDTVRGEIDEIKEELSEAQCRERILPSTVAIITKNYLGYTAGTGIVLDSMGHILTNAHLVSTLDTVLVQNPSTRNFDQAVITGSSPCDDLAVIRVSENLQNYAPAYFGKSSELSTGDEVYACGYSMDSSEEIASTSCTFILTRIHEMDAEYQYYGLNNIIQIEADLNYENSGGPLMNRYGEVVGILSRGLFDSTSFSHSIPIETAQKIIPTLLRRDIKNIGAGFVPNSTSLSSAQGNPYMEGSLVIVSMEKGSPLYEAGWYRFDILYMADGVELWYPGDLLRIIRARKSGEEIKLSGIGLFEDGVYRPYETVIAVP